MFIEKNEPPCKIDEILSFNFENLQKFLSFLQLNDNQLTSKIKNLSLKISEIDNFKFRLEEAEFKLNLAQNKFKEIDKSLNAHQLKLIDLDSKHNTSNNQILKLETNINEYTTKTIALEENINNLNRLCEENTKTIRKINDTNNEIKVNQERDKIEIIMIKNELIENLTTNLKNYNSTTDKNFSDINENIKSINKKLESTEDSLIKIAEVASRNLDVHYSNDNNRNSSNRNNHIVRTENSSNEINFQTKNSPNQINIYKTNNNHDNYSNYPSNQELTLYPTIHTNNNENFNSIQSDINKILTHIDWLKNENENRKETIGNLYKSTEEITENIKSMRSLMINNNNPYFLNDQEDFFKKEKFSEARNSSQISNDLQQKIYNKRGSISVMEDGEIMNDNLEKIHGNLKIVSQNIHNRVTKEELERVNKLFKLEIEKLNEKFSSQIRGIDGKIKKYFSSHSESGYSTDIIIDKNILNQIQEMINHHSREIIEKEITSMNLLNTNLFQESQDKHDKMKLEIDKIFESLVDIRKTFIQSKQPVEEMIRDSNSRVLELEILTRNQRIQIDDIIKNIEGELYDSNTINYSEKSSNPVNKQCIRDSIKNLNASIKFLTERIDKLQAKQNNFYTEILSKIKKDLQFESNRILDEFKHDLRSSIHKIQEQLKEKVDRFNLDEFGKKIDNKMLKEIGKKLDKNDLKKNNCAINKKINTLENKISKTLVDTLIDIQIDEAPLIVKQSMHGDKCASCNQFLQNGQQMHDHHQGNNYNLHEGRNLTKSMKYRYKNNIKNFDEESNENINKTVRISHLPEINTIMSKTSSEFNFSLGKKDNF